MGRALAGAYLTSGWLSPHGTSGTTVVTAELQINEEGPLRWVIVTG